MPPGEYVKNWLLHGLPVIGSVPYDESPGVNPHHIHSRLNVASILPPDLQEGFQCEWMGMAAGDTAVRPFWKLYAMPNTRIVSMLFCIKPRVSRVDPGRRTEILIA